MVSPYNFGNVPREGGHRHSAGTGQSVWILPFDDEGGYNLQAISQKNKVAPLPEKKNHLRPNWSPGWNR